jgi:hypothetical protein
MAGFFGLALIAISRFSVEGKVGAGSMTMTIQDWDKADSEKRGNIVRRALQSPRGPELMLLKKIASEPDSKQFPQISLLRLGFDDRWFNETSDDDRRMIVLLALGELLPPEARAIPPLEGRHPGVQFALASSVSLDHSGDLFQRISLENLEKLPDPIGSCIKLMRQLGIRTLSEMAPRAYAHLVVGSITTKALEEYFSKVRDPALVRQLLGFLIPFLRADSPEAGYVEEYLNLRGSDFDDTYRWFNSEPIAQWSSAPAMIRLSLLVPHLPEAPITPEQLIDLLQFPDQTVRSHARDRLSGNIVPQRYKTLLLVLASDENKLTRSQAIFLLSALQVSDEEAFTFLSKWFRGEPDPDSVFLALLSQSRAQRSTPFDIEAARYLISRPWSASTAELAELARHPEPLARALAYSKLTMNTPEERAILQERFRSEDSESLKEQLRSKMNNP